jgi:cob(I)alamin adenosyltransferase
MKEMKIYTRTGDKGETSLYSGERVLKNDPFIEAVGTIDECNSAIGVAVAQLTDSPDLMQLRRQLIDIQHALFDVGAAIATPRTRASTTKINKTRFDQEATTNLERWMDEMEEKLPKLTTFILPGGHPAGASLHLARSVCRRAERKLVPLNQHADVADSVFIYINRLSDFLFMASRSVNKSLGCLETPWEHHKTFND